MSEKKPAPLTTVIPKADKVPQLQEGTGSPQRKLQVLTMAKEPNRPATHTFRAVWPVVEGNGTADTDAELILQALGDLPAVARRHNATIVGQPRACITEGRRVPGSAGHKYVVVAEAPAREAAPRPYRHGAERTAAR